MTDIINAAGNPSGVPIPTNWFPSRLQPYNNIQPFTYRDGQTYLEVLEDMREWLRDTLAPYVDSEITEYVTAFNSALDNITKYAADFQTFVDTNKTDFDAATAAFNAAVTAANAGLLSDRAATEAARDLAQTYAANTLAFQDTTLSGLLNNSGSATTTALNSSVVANFAEAEVSLGRIPRKVMDTPPATFYEYAVGCKTATIVSPGTGYTVGDEIGIQGGTLKQRATFIVKAVDANGGVTSLARNYRGAYKLPPASPNTPLWGTGTGLQVNCDWTDAPTLFQEGHANQVNIVDGTNALYTGYTLTSVNGGYGNPDQGTELGVFWTWEWDTDATYFEIDFYSNSARFQLYIDGERVSPTQFSETNGDHANVLYTITNGGVLRMRSYKLVARAGRLRLVFAGRDELNTFRPPSRVRPVIWGLGDSYMWGEGANDNTQTMFNIMCENLGYTAQPEALTGAQWTTSRVGSALDRINATLTKMTRTPAYIVWELGYNDRNNTDTAALTTAIDAAIARAKAIYPNVPQVMFGPATPLGETPELAAMKTLMQARAQAASIPFVDVSGWVTANNKGRYTSTDNVHPTPLGHAYIGARKAAAMRALFPTITI